MLLIGKLKYVGTEKKKNKSGVEYNVSSFAQEGTADILTCMDKTEKKFKFGDDIVGVLNYNPKYNVISIVDIQ